MRTSFVLFPAFAVAALAAPSPAQLDKRQNIIGCVFGSGKASKVAGRVDSDAMELIELLLLSEL
jgi:hypothetical protein